MKIDDVWFRGEFVDILRDAERLSDEFRELYNHYIDMMYRLSKQESDDEL